VYGPLLNIVDAHVLQLCNAYVFCKEVRLSLQAVLLACCWKIWKEKSKRCFTHGVTSVEALCDKVKTTASWWFKSSKKCVSYDLGMWWSNPLPYFGIRLSRKVFVGLLMYFNRPFVILFC
jgi:hypothetical protein